MGDAATPPTDPPARKAAIREQARKNRVAQKDKDELSRRICGTFMSLPAYKSAKAVMWYVDAGSEVRTRHTLPEALTHGKRVVVPWCVVETNQLELFLLEDVSELVEGAYKILEPKAELRALPNKVVRPEELVGQRAVRRGKWKYVIDREVELLFDMEADPGERKTLAFQHPALVAELRKALIEWEVKIATGK